MLVEGVVVGRHIVDGVWASVFRADDTRQQPGRLQGLGGRLIGFERGRGAALFAAQLVGDAPHYGQVDRREIGQITRAVHGQLAGSGVLGAEQDVGLRPLLAGAGAGAGKAERQGGLITG